MITKTHIISEIKRTAQENRGSPLGIARFEAETGIKSSDWMGKFWARWGDALVEAGFQPNVLQGPRSEDDLLERLAFFARELGHIPVANEIKLKARSEPGFPWHNTFSRFGGKQKLVARLREFALTRGWEDVALLCQSVIARPTRREPDAAAGAVVEAEPELGYVYLLKSGRFFKVGRSSSVGRRERELAIQLPEEAKMVHSIKTDDPVGIENYWHGRFGDRRKNGEWFELTAKDVAAFKRRKFM
ncbi:MAG: GIY-YIG nuclease family protein [Planctomycetia bacterium]|nr:GIY-YIG nuclease family protein [Planctomycetia bacterium]